MRIIPSQNKRLYTRKIMLSTPIFAMVVVIVITLLVFDLFLISTNRELKQHYRSSQERPLQDVDRNLSIWELTSEGQYLKNIEIESLDKDTISLCKDGHKPLIIFRVMQENCIVCVDSVVSVLSDQLDLFDQQSLMILTSDKDNRSLKLFSRSLTDEIEVYRLIDNSFEELKIERMQTPYLFVLSLENQMTNVFIPEKRSPDATVNYLKLMHKKYFK